MGDKIFCHKYTGCDTECFFFGVLQFGSLCLEVRVRVFPEVGCVPKMLKNFLATKPEKTVSGEEVVVVHWLLD